jgi:PTH2 family peptidyl-tRNA hydrolase
MKNTKQVIIWRNDLKVRTGKKMAMASHASMAFLTKGMDWYPVADGGDGFVFSTKIMRFDETEEITHWLKNSFKKIVCYVNSEEELVAIHQKALDNGLMSSIIEDNGATEFNGVKTLTCCCIGPHYESKFIGLTDHLPLL